MNDLNRTADHDPEGADLDQAEIALRATLGRGDRGATRRSLADYLDALTGDEPAAGLDDLVVVLADEASEAVQTETLDDLVLGHCRARRLALQAIDAARLT